MSVRTSTLGRAAVVAWGLAAISVVLFGAALFVLIPAVPSIPENITPPNAILVAGLLLASSVAEPRVGVARWAAVGVKAIGAGLAVWIVGRAMADGLYSPLHWMVR